VVDLLLILKQTTEGGLEAANLCKEKVEKALEIAKEVSTKATTASNKCSTLLENAKALAIGQPLQGPPLSLSSMVFQVNEFFWPTHIQFNKI